MAIDAYNGFREQQVRIVLSSTVWQIKYDEVNFNERYHLADNLEEGKDINLEDWIGVNPFFSGSDAF